MPLETQVIGVKGPRDVIQVYWDYPHLSCFLTAALIEGDPDFEYQDGKKIGELEGTGKFVDFSWSPIYYFDTKCSLWKEGRIMLTRDHRFTLGSGEEFLLKKGYTLKMHRTSR